MDSYIDENGGGAKLLPDISPLKTNNFLIMYRIEAPRPAHIVVNNVLAPFKILMDFRQ